MQTSEKINQPEKVRKERIRISGTNNPAIRSAMRCIGAYIAKDKVCLTFYFSTVASFFVNTFDVWASSMRVTIWDNIVSPLT